MSNKKRIFVITTLFLIFSALYLFWGLNKQNISFFLSRRFNALLAIILSSYAISFSTVSFQTITNNKILTPSVIGLDSLYLFVQTLIVYLFGSKTLTMLTGYKNYFISIIVMVGFSLILFLFLFRKEKQSIFFVVLAGMVFGNLFSGLSNFMQVLLDPNEFLVAQGKMFASFDIINTKLLFVSLVILAIIFFATLTDLKKLDVLSLGRETAINLGIDYQKFVFKNFIIISILVAVSTALTGPITFLGILISNISRQIFKTYKHFVIVLGAFLLGSLFLVFGQFVLSKFSTGTTISVVINFFGGLYFIYLILKEAKI